MTNKEHKELALKASKEILKEYKDNAHRSSTNSCSLCKAFYDQSKFNYIRCKNCPMSIFEGYLKLQFGCMNRKCKPVSQLSSRRTIDTENLTFIKNTKRVIEFYEKFIELVEKSRHCRVKTPSGNQSTFARKLLKLDNETYLKHKKAQQNET